VFRLSQNLQGLTGNGLDRVRQHEDEILGGRSSGNARSLPSRPLSSAGRGRLLLRPPSAGQLPVSGSHLPRTRRTGAGIHSCWAFRSSFRSLKVEETKMRKVREDWAIFTVVVILSVRRFGRVRLRSVWREQRNHVQQPGDKLHLPEEAHLWFDPPLATKSRLG
jgi:hypothetical protein